MKRCPGCSRHLAPRESTCPFCHANVGASPGGAALALGLVAGLAVSGCGDDGKTSESSTSTTESSTTESSTSTGSTSTSAGETEAETGTGTSTSTSTSTTTNDAGVAAYGGPPVDSMTGDNRFIPPDADAPPSPQADPAPALERRR